eukprot:10444907-Lingulodinium_polyedra.AAC.1
MQNWASWSASCEAVLGSSGMEVPVHAARQAERPLELQAWSCSTASLLLLVGKWQSILKPPSKEHAGLVFTAIIAAACAGERPWM